jgi:hypothetical protein
MIKGLASWPWVQYLVTTIEWIVWLPPVERCPQSSLSNLHGSTCSPPSNPRNVIDRDIALRTFNRAQVSSVDTAVVSECFLAQRTASAEPAHVFCQHVP